MTTKLTAGPTPDGGFVTRRTANDYSHVVVVIDKAEIVYSPKHPDANEHGYIPNPKLGTWVPVSWHGRYDLAVKGAEKMRFHGYQATIVPVVR